MTTSVLTPVLRVQRLSKHVDAPGGKLELLSDIEFTIFRGESVAIVGASGAGKSTLLGLLAGLDTPTEGKVMLESDDLFALDEDDRAQLRGAKMGFVFQSFQLLPNLTALENVMLPLELQSRKDAVQVASEVLERVGLGKRGGHYPRQLSGGEQQRVAIARAFAVQPSVLLADEPTGNLDAETGEKIIDLLFGLNKASGTTLVLVTHDARLAARCERKLEIVAGRLVNDA